MKVLKNEPLKNHTSFRVGGPASAYVIPEDADELKKLIVFLYKEKLPYRILGNGTNLLVSDEGVPGVVIELRSGLDGLELLDDRRDGSIRIQAMAGTLLSRTALYAYEHGLAGMEALRGIPGTVGGAVTMNAGAYGTEMLDVLESCEVITREGQVKTLPLEALELGYRHSIIPESGLIVLSAVFRLRKGDPEEILKEMQEYQRRRAEKQPLDKASAGSTFKRPEGHFAGQLIEESGLRGYRHNGAAVSEKHCGFIVNEGSATASDIYALIQEVRTKVLEHTGVELTPEVKMWGSF